MPITVHVKCSSGEKVSIQIEPAITVRQFKESLSELVKVAPADQRLVFSGHVLKDDQTLESCSVKEDSTIHLVKSIARPAQTQAQPQPQQPQPVQSVPQQSPQQTPLGAFPGAIPPAQAAQMLNNPEMQGILSTLMSNPQLLNQLVQSHPQLQNNPLAQQLLRDPEFLRSLLDPQALQRILGAARGRSGMGAPGGPISMEFFRRTLVEVMLRNGLQPSPSTLAAVQSPQTPTPPSQQSPVTPFPGPLPATAAQGMGGLSPEMLSQFLRNQAGQQQSTGPRQQQAAAQQQQQDDDPPEIRFQVQLQSLSEMGFTDVAANINALLETGGNVNAAIDRLLSS